MDFTIEKLEALLEQNDFSRDYIKEIVAKAQNEFSNEELKNNNILMKKVSDWIADNLIVSSDFYENKSPHIIATVGSVGSGKTSILVKLIAELLMNANKNKKTKPKIRIITTDNMKLGAKEELELYTNSLELKVDSVNSKEELKKLLDDYSRPNANVDFVFIDTSGFSPKDQVNISYVQKLLDVANKNLDIHLVISACTKYTDLEQIFKAYENFCIKSVIVSNCDATLTYGNVLSILHKMQKPVSLISEGQTILTSLIQATPAYFLKRLNGFSIEKEHNFISDTEVMAVSNALVKRNIKAYKELAK